MIDRENIAFIAALNMLYGYEIVCMEEEDTLLHAYCIFWNPYEVCYIDERGKRANSKTFFEELDLGFEYKNGGVYKDGKEIMMRICDNPGDAFDKYVYGDWYSERIKKHIENNEILYKVD